MLTVQPTFKGYNSPLKKLYKRGKLPIENGFYGGKLTRKNVSLELLQPHSQEGKTTLDNLVLATKENNNTRGADNIRSYLNAENIINYLTQFIGIKCKDFDGNQYITGIIKTLQSLI